MLIGIIENDVVTKIAHYKNLFPNTSFTTNGPSNEFLEANNAKRVSVYRDYDPTTQKLVRSAPYVDGDWIYTVRVENLDTTVTAIDEPVIVITTETNPEPIGQTATTTTLESP